MVVYDFCMVVTEMLEGNNSSEKSFILGDKFRHISVHHGREDMKEFMTAVVGERLH